MKRTKGLSCWATCRSRPPGGANGNEHVTEWGAEERRPFTAVWLPGRSRNRCDVASEEAAAAAAAVAAAAAAAAVAAAAAAAVNTSTDTATCSNRHCGHANCMI